MIELRPAIARLPANTNHTVYPIWKGLKIGNHFPDLTAPRQVAKNLVTILLADDPLSQAAASRGLTALPLPANKMSVIGATVGQHESFIVDVREALE